MAAITPARFFFRALQGASNVPVVHSVSATEIPAPRLCRRAQELPPRGVSARTVCVRSAVEQEVENFAAVIVVRQRDGEEGRGSDTGL